MRSGVVVAAVGMNPPVVTEFLLYLLKRDFIPRKLVLLATDNEKVREGVVLIETAVSVRDDFRGMRMEVVDLPFDDINSEEDSLEFMRIAGRCLTEETGERMVLISGGRKNMSVELAMLSQLLAVRGVYHVINRNVKEMNAALESVRGLIDDLYRSENRRDFYLRNREELDPIMWPPLSEFFVIRLPLIPVPYSHLRKVVGMLRGGTIEDEELFNLLFASGLVQRSGRKAIPTDYGRRLGEVLAEVVGEVGR